MKREEKRMQVRQIIESANTQFVTIAFVKKDGTQRRMNIQPHAIRAHIVGEAASESAQKAVQTRKENHPELYNCWDVKANGARSVNMDTVYEIKAQGKLFVFPLELED
jgi:hypothetical protein